MFFFLSLAIVFLFILLMCYYLKNKINVIEKKVSSQTEVLGKLIREFKFQSCLGGAGGTNDNNEYQKERRLEPVLENEQEDEDSETDSETLDYSEDDNTDVGMDKVNDDELIEKKQEDIDETVKTFNENEDEYKDLDFEKVANEEVPVDFYSSKELHNEKTEIETHVVIENEPQCHIKDDEIKEEILAEPKDILEDNNTEDIQTTDDKQEDYKKMSLVQLKHIAQHTFHLSTTQISKMKKDELLKWILSQ